MSKNKTMGMCEILQSALKGGIMSFYYEKSDGTLRHAIGTNNPMIYSELYHYVRKTNRTHATPDNVVVYFDIERGEFRSFRKDKLLTFDLTEVDISNLPKPKVFSDLTLEEQYRKANSEIEYWVERARVIAMEMGNIVPR